MNLEFSFFKYVSKQDALLIINNGTLFYTNPMNFNDPFDIAPSFPAEGKSKNYKFILEYNGIKPFSHGKRKKAVLQKLNAETLRINFLREWVVTCFSKSPFILPLWAHYADNHKGCVLEFKVNRDIIDSIISAVKINHMDTEIVYPLPVVYSKKRPQAYDSNGFLSEELAQQMILTKDEDWAYEQELRSFKLKTQGAYPFKKEQLHRVYCGMKMDKEGISQIKEAINKYREAHKHHVKINQVYLDRNEYKMGIL